VSQDFCGLVLNVEKLVRLDNLGTNGPLVLRI